jgi:hypothetical protein
MKTKYKNLAKKTISLMEIEKPPKSLHFQFISLISFFAKLHQYKRGYMVLQTIIK